MGREAIEYLEQRARLGMKLGLGTTRRLLGALGHPDRAYATLLVAGTNGKGSVVACVDAGLRAAGLRVGRYTSPHLMRLNERIVVGGRPIAQRDLERAILRVRRAAEELVERGALADHPTHFEVLTAAALDHFRRRRVQVAVLEVGLGGRLDATNAVAPLASAIVSIQHDHQAQLGRSLARIAAEKAGVLRRGRTTVVGTLPRAARRTLARLARAKGARLLEAQAGVTVRPARGGLEVTTPRARYAGLRPLPGAHQEANLLVALRLLEEARAAGLRFDLARAGRGTARARWPGRLQWVPGRPPLLLDGAHNPAAARALASHLRGLARPVSLLFGAMRDKRVAEMARALFPVASAVVLTSVGGERAATPAALARRARGVSAPLHLEAAPERALALARRLTPRGGVVVVAGSLYLVGAVMERLGLRG